MPHGYSCTVSVFPCECGCTVSVCAFQGGPSLTDIIRYQEARRRDAGLQNGSAARRGLANGRRRDERVRTPPAVAGRKHYRVQTEPYLEEVGVYHTLRYTHYIPC